MKYCKICKTVAKETDATCARGHALSVLGASPGRSATASPAPGAAPKPADPPPGARPSTVMFSLLGEVRKLEEVKQKNVRRGRTFGLLSLAAALIIALILYGVYSRTVLAYAILDDIRVEQDPAMDWKIHISYEVRTPGQVAFDRRSGASRIEKLDLIDGTGRRGFSWSWPSDPRTGVDLQVRYRDGWLPGWHRRHFDVRSAGRDSP